MSITAAARTRHVYIDRADLAEGLRRYVLAYPARQQALRRASAEQIAMWLMVSRSCLFETLGRLGLTLGDIQRERL